MLLYNNDGTVSSIIAHTGPDGKMTSSAEVLPTINQYSSTGSIRTANFSFHNTVSKSSATVDINSKQPVAASYPSRTENNFSSSYYHPLMIGGDTTLDAIIDGRLIVDIDTASLKDGSKSPLFNTIKASKFSTPISNGLVLVSGDDAYLKDSNLANGFNIVGQQNQYRGWVKFGQNGPLVGHNGNQATPAPGDPFAITGSLLVSGSHLYMYTGCVTGSGWNQII
jgi:hypothetical protein